MLSIIQYKQGLALEERTSSGTTCSDFSRASTLSLTEPATITISSPRDEWVPLSEEQAQTREKALAKMKVLPIKPMARPTTIGVTNKRRAQTEAHASENEEDEQTTLEDMVCVITVWPFRICHIFITIVLGCCDRERRIHTCTDTTTCTRQKALEQLIEIRALIGALEDNLHLPCRPRPPASPPRRPAPPQGRHSRSPPRLSQTQTLVGTKSKPEFDAAKTYCATAPTGQKPPQSKSPRRHTLLSVAASSSSKSPQRVPASPTSSSCSLRRRAAAGRDGDEEVLRQLHREIADLDQEIARLDDGSNNALESSH